MKVLLISILSSVVLTACMVNPQREKTPSEMPVLSTSYDVKIYKSATQKPVSIKQAANELRDADVVFIGEFHGNHGSHWLQAQLQAELYKQRPRQILSMEQFSRDKQEEVNRYLKGEIGEVALLEKAKAWPNYKASYRPVVEFAKQHKLPVIAANAPADVVRCIGRQGEAYLHKLTQQQRQQLASNVFLNDLKYQHAFSKVMHSSGTPTTQKKTELSNSYLAQLSRDNTMAESILKAHSDNPKHQVIHLNGAFHSDYGLGTVVLLKQRKPDLVVKVVSPVRLDAKNPTPYDKGDMVYLLKPLPQQYANDTERNAAFKSMFSQSRSKKCR